MQINDVQVTRPEEMHLVGLMLAKALEPRLPRTTRAQKLDPMALDIDGMKLTVRLENGTVYIEKGESQDAATRIALPLEALLNINHRARLVKSLISPTHGNFSTFFSSNGAAAALSMPLSKLSFRGNPLNAAAWLPVLLP